jgi:hypothetical protein
MLIPLILLAAQSPDVTAVVQEFKSTQAKDEQILNQTFDCMDQQVKTQLKDNFLEATPASVVDGALKTCSHFRDQMIENDTSTYITKEKVTSLADDWIKSLRETYLKHITEQFAKPEFIELRSKVAISEWRKCVTDKAAEWSRLTDEAQTVARAAVTSCASFRPKVSTILMLELQSKKLPQSGIRQVLGTIDSTLQDVAVETVISERAKRLPPSSSQNHKATKG